MPSACGFPDATNTGAHGPLTVVNGNVTLSTAGMVYADREVRGCINVTAAGVTMRNVRVLAPASCYYAVDYFPSSPTAARLLVEDTTIVCSNVGGTGLGEKQFTARRVDVSGCVNGFDIDRDATVVDSWCHGLTDESIYPAAHTDCVQGIQDRDVTIAHNTLITPFYATSAVGGCCGITTRLRWHVDGNLMDGGAYTIYCLNSPGTEVDSTVSGNRFGPGGWNHSYASACNRGGIVWSGNVRDATSAILSAT